VCKVAHQTKALPPSYSFLSLNLLSLTGHLLFLFLNIERKVYLLISFKHHVAQGLAGVLLLTLVSGESSLPTMAKPQAAKPAVITELTEQIDSYTLQPGTYLLCTSESYIRTDMHRVGDPVVGHLVHNVYVNNVLILGTATRLYGTITRMEQPMEGKDAVMAFTMNKLELPTGELLPIEAYLDTGQTDHSWGGGLQEGTEPFVVSHRVMGIGRYNKVIMGGPRKQGRHYQSQPGDYWRVVLQTPVTVPVLRPLPAPNLYNPMQAVP
jgi:hypothetical protein